MTKPQSASLLCTTALCCICGCATRAQSGAAIGAGAGVAIGAGVGSLVSSSAGAGALIGAGVGAVSGALIGNELDEQDRRREQELAGATTRPAGAYTTHAPIRRQDVIAWKRHGISEAVIADRIERSSTRFRLTAADENTLRENGISEELIQTMHATNR